MFVSKASHAAIVAALQSQITELRNDRDYYRRIVLGDRGLPEAQRQTQSSAPVKDELTEFGAHWTDAEWDAYNTICQIQVQTHGVGDPEILKQDYLAAYGNTSPLEILAE